MRAPPRSSRLPLFVTVACLVVFLAWLGLQLVARSGHERSRAWLAGVDLRASVVAEEHHDFAYDGSPWLRSLEVVGRHVPVDVEALHRTADAIAQEVGWWMLAEARTDDIQEAERALWAQGRAERLPLRIAEALVDRGVRHAPDTPATERYDARALRLDGDGIVHLILHVAWRLDLDVVAEAAPLRIYPVFRQPGGERRIHVEPTAIDRALRDPRAFVVDRHHHRHARDGAPHPADAGEAGLYEPLDTRTLDDEIAAHAVFGLLAAGAPVDPVAELEPLLADTRSTRLVSFMHRWLVRDAERALARGSADIAALRAARAIALRRSHGPYHLWTRPEENRWMGDAMAKLRKDASTRAALDRAVATRRDAPAPSAVCDVLAPLGDELATLLPACGPPPAPVEPQATGAPPGDEG